MFPNICFHDIRLLTKYWSVWSDLLTRADLVSHLSHVHASHLGPAQSCHLWASILLTSFSVRQYQIKTNMFMNFHQHHKRNVHRQQSPRWTLSRPPLTPSPPFHQIRHFYRINIMTIINQMIIRSIFLIGYWSALLRSSWKKDKTEGRQLLELISLLNITHTSSGLLFESTFLSPFCWWWCWWLSSRLM